MKYKVQVDLTLDCGSKHCRNCRFLVTTETIRYTHVYVEEFSHTIRCTLFDKIVEFRGLNAMRLDECLRFLKKLGK